MLDPFSFDPRTPYRELREPPLPDALRALALECFAAQRRALATSHATAAAATPGSDAVSEPALERILASGETVGGIVTRRELATAIPFNARHTRDAVRSREVAAAAGSSTTRSGAG